MTAALRCRATAAQTRQCLLSLLGCAVLTYCAPAAQLLGGVIAVLFKNHDQGAFLTRWFESPKVPGGLRSTGGDWHVAADNFYIAACYSAGTSGDVRPGFAKVARLACQGEPGKAETT